MTRVVDTNVPLVAKHREEWPPDLADACEELLERILEEAVAIVTDADGEIMEEYLQMLSLSGRPSLGDAFVKYVHDFRYTWPQDARPDIQRSAVCAYSVLNGDDADIDPSDRKFVAAAKVAAVPVFQASDSKWLNWGAILDRHGVQVIFLHEPTLRDIYKKKFGYDAP